MSKRVFFAALTLTCLAGSLVQGQVQRGFLKHDVQVMDELGRKVTGVTSFNIYLSDTTTNPVIYTDRDLANAITLPMTTSSTNTTLVDGHCYWYGPDGWDYTLTDGTRTITNASGPVLTSGVGELVMPTWLVAATSTAYTDVQTITMGTDSDWVFNGGTTAKLLTLTPAADASTIYIGNGTASSDVRIYGSSAAIYAQFDESSDGLFMTHYDVNMNDDSRLYFGTDQDWYAQSGTTKMLDLIPATSDESSAVRIGANSAGADLYLYGATSGDYAQFDASGNVLLMEDINIGLGDGTKLLFGDTIGTGDFSISDESDVLTFAQIVADVGTMAWGADNAGIDQTWYGESASAYMKWDATSADQLIIVGVDSSGTLLSITSADTTGDSDTVAITHNSGGDGIQITDSATDGTAINAISAASQTTAVVKIDGATGNFIGADNVGALHITGDTAGAHVGATLMYVANSAQPIDAAEGFMARFVDTGTARTTAAAVEIETTNTTPALKLNNQLQITGADSTGVLAVITGINTTGNTDSVQIAHSGTGDALQITASTATAVALNLVGATNQTTRLQTIDGDTAEWIGKDNEGMLQVIKGATALAHTGSTQLIVTNGAQPLSGAEGFMARFVDTGTARTDAYGVEIETTNTTPALHLNNQMFIEGADSTGVLMKVTGIDTTGNSDTMRIAHSGTGDGLQITCTEADSVALKLIAAAAQTTSAMKVDGATGADWRGAANVGMVHLTSDGPLADVAASLLYINNTGVPTNDSRGSSLRIVDTGNAAAGTAGYAVYISATDATVEALYIDDGKVLIDEALTVGGTITSTAGVQSASVSVAADAEATQVTIPAGTRWVNATNAGAATQVICLPVGVVGNIIDIYSAATCELQTIAASNATINGVDCDGGSELVLTATQTYHLWCTAANTWVATATTAAGAAVATLVPDADS